MPTVAAVVAALAEVTRPETAAGWDPVGLQLGDPNAEASRVGVCHEVSEAVVAGVEESGVDLLVTYHPLLFSPVTRLVAGRSPSARAMRLIRGGVSLLVTHTDFDAAPGGAADSLAAALGLEDPLPFGSDDEEGLPDIGRVGRFTGSLSQLRDRVVASLGADTGLRVSGEPETTLERVAVVPGSGSGMIYAAAVLADALVTGDVSHHRAVAALDAGLAVIDPGHVATERPGMKALLALVGGIPGVEVVDLTHLDPATWS